jgi:hypothetical protein
MPELQRRLECVRRHCQARCSPYFRRSATSSVVPIHATCARNWSPDVAEKAAAPETVAVAAMRSAFTYLARPSRLWGAQTRSTSCRHAVFVNQSAESIAPTEASRLRRRNRAEGGSRLWWCEPETAMRPMSVVARDVDSQDALELRAPDD